MFFPDSTWSKFKEGTKRGAKKLKEKAKEGFGEVNRLLVGDKEIKLAETVRVSSVIDEPSLKVEFLNTLSRQLIFTLTALGFAYSFKREFSDPKNPVLEVIGSDKLVLEDQNYAQRNDLVRDTALLIMFSFERMDKTLYLSIKYRYDFKDVFLQPKAEAQFKRLRASVKEAINTTKNQDFFLIC